MLPLAETTKQHILTIAIDSNISTAIKEADLVTKMAKIKKSFCAEVEERDWEEATKKYKVTEEKLQEFIGKY